MNLAKLMIPKVFTALLNTNNTVRQGLEVFRQHGYTAVPVLDEKGRYVGCVTEGDFLRHLLQTGTTDMKAHERCRISSIIRREFCPALGIDAEEAAVHEAMMNQNFAPIVDDRGALCGILTRKKYMEYLAETKGDS